MAQTFGDLLQSIDAHNQREQMKETWGHLAAEKDKTYTGRVVFAVGCFGDDELNPTPIAYDFAELDSSPWFYEALNEFLQDLPDDQRKPGCVYEWRGTMRNYEFTGRIKRLLNANG